MSAPLWIFPSPGVCVGMGCVLVEVDAAVRELAEGSLLLDLGRLDGVLEEEQVSMMCAGEGRGDGIADTHIFVSHDCGVDEGSFFEMGRKTKGMSAGLDVSSVLRRRTSLEFCECPLMA